jgi:predicted HD superfamily hydrolase involved in NAD metabolism
MSTASTWADWDALARYQHSVRVSELAGEIARAHGLPEDSAALAGLLHDFAREIPDERMAASAREAGCDMAIPAVWHGPVAARMLRRDHGLQNEQVLSAIARHTVGDPDMTALDAVVYVADLAAHDVVPGLLELARTDLRAALLRAMAATLGYLLERRRPIDLQAVRAWNGLLRRDMLL